MTYTYGRDQAGAVTKCNAHFSITGDTMRPNVHYDPTHTVAYAVEKYAIRLIYEIAAARSHQLLHLYITSALTSET